MSTANNNPAPESSTVLASETDESPESLDPKCLALAKHLDVEPSEVSECYGSGDNMYEAEHGAGEYLVLTDEEADTAWDAALDSYIDECMEIPKSIEPYFDRAKWKADARHDGRGHSLSGYDGEENEEKIGEDYYYIYRIN